MRADCYELTKLDRSGWSRWCKTPNWDEPRTMKVWQLSDAQKAFISKRGRDRIPVADICRKVGISQATYFKVRCLLPDAIRRLNQLEENSKLKKLSPIGRSQIET